jgi:hypothetical protein
MDWVVPIALLVLAAVLAGQGARLVAGGRRMPAEEGEVGTDRAVLSLVLLCAALGIGAVGAALVPAGVALVVQIAVVVLVAVAAVSLPVAGVLLAFRRGRR